MSVMQRRSDAAHARADFQAHRETPDEEFYSVPGSSPTATHISTKRPELRFCALLTGEDTALEVTGV